MTIADPQTSSSRNSWLDRLRGSRPGASAGSRGNGPGGTGRAGHLHKPPGDMVDFLIMSTLDTKAPPEHPGTGDLLDAMVQDHLQRATAGAPVDNTPVVPEGQADLLQREIATLLRDGGEAAVPGTHGGPAAENSGNVAPMGNALADEPGQMSPAAPAKKAISRAELDVLLAESAPALGGAVGTLAPGSPADVPDQKLTEAEGVLAEELSKLMAETEAPAHPPVAPPAVQAAPAAAAAVGPVALPATPAKTAKDAPASPVAAVAETATVATEAPAPAVTEAAADAQQPAPDAAVASGGSMEKSAAKLGLLGYVRAMMTGITLMAAQVVDLPFNWMDEIYKNIIGVAALLLGLGGVVMWMLSRYMN